MGGGRHNTDADGTLKRKLAAGPGQKVDGTSVNMDWGQDSLGLQGSGVT